MSNSEFYIKKVKIKGIFGTKNIEWNLNEEVNIIGGINGSGKSTLINSIYSLLKLGEESLDNIFDILENAIIEFSNGYSIILEKNSKEIPLQAAIIWFKEYDLIDSISIQSPSGYIIPDKNDRLFNSSLISSAEHQIVAEEIIKGIGNKNIKTTLDLSLFREINRRNELVTNSSLLGGNSFKYILKSNNFLFKTINDFFKDTDKTLIKESSSFDILIENKTISCYNLSTGEKQLLLILLTVFNTNGKPCILLMDEPDLGIHIDWKKKLIKAIRDINPKAQLILSTHAPSMIGGWFNNVKEINEISTKI